MVPELHGVGAMPQPFDTAPRGFRDKLRHSPVFEIFTRQGAIDSAELSEFEARKTTRWRERTARWREGKDIEPQDSKFTLIVPIHNEQAMLRDSLSALMASDIPRDVHMHVVFVTNACTDGSVGIVKSFMENLGEVQ